MNAYMPFGIGPHKCIGGRLAMMQMKLGLLYFYRNHYVTICEKTPTKLHLDPRAVMVQAQGGIQLKVVRDPLF